jgi:hypothetical protein
VYREKQVTIHLFGSNKNKGFLVIGRKILIRFVLTKSIKEFRIISNIFKSYGTGPKSSSNRLGSFLFLFSCFCTCGLAC